MKPIIIFAEEKNGKVTLDKETLQELVDQAYRDGRMDASRYDYISVTPRWVNNDWTVTTSNGTSV